MRIALVDPASWSVAYDLPLAEALARAGHGVTVHCTRSPHVGLPTSDVAGVRIEESFYRRGYVVLPRRAGRALQHPVDVARLVGRLRRDADAVLVQWLPGGQLDALAWAGLARQVPVTFTAHNAQGRAEAVDTRLLRGFSAVAAHSDGGAEALRAAGVAPVWRTTLGAYGQYATVPPPAEPPVADLPADAPLVVLPGLLRAYKGVEVLLAAWPQVRRAVPTARLVVAGRVVDAVLPPDHDLPEGVTVIARFLEEAELGWLLRRADVCCLPYTRIDMSGVAAAALACGTPLLLSDVGGFGEYVGRGAELVPAGDADALATGLVALLTDPDRRGELAHQARAAAGSVYAWESIALEWAERLSELVEERATRRA